MGLFGKAVSGQRVQPSAGDWNAVLDAAIGNKRSSRSFTDLEGNRRQGTLIRVRNESGSNQSQFAVLGLDDPIITPTANANEFKRCIAFKAVLPDAGVHEGKFCVLQEPIPSGKIGAALVAGVSPVRITVSGSIGDYAEIADGVTTLAEGDTGSATILWAESSGGSTRWAIVRLGGGSTGIQSITVKKDDGSPSYTDVTEIQVDADTFTLTQPSAGKALISNKGASGTYTFVTSVTCSGTTLTVKGRSVTILDGHITSVGSETTL